MGSENRIHDEQTKKLAQKYDKIKAENKAKQLARKKAHDEKYGTFGKEYERKDSSHELQMKLHKLVFDTPKADQTTKQWLQEYRKVRFACIKAGLWDGFAGKYQLNQRGYEI